jgi:excisionase family DNA binding protein
MVPLHTPIKKDQIIKLNQMQLKNSDIARLLKVSRQYVSRVLSQYSNGKKYKAPRARNKEFITTGDASHLLGVSEATIRRWADQGKIPSFRINIGRRDRRINARELEQVIIKPGLNLDEAS